MKKIIYTLIIFCSIFCNIDTKAQSFTCNTTTCIPTLDPPALDCFTSIEKYIARAVLADGLTNMNANMCWNSTNGCTSYPIGYCPTKYCEDIATLVDINAFYISNVAGPWGGETQIWDNPTYSPCSYAYYLAAKQAVKDINHAYDCAGLRRPVIEASIFEYVSTDINVIVIPTWVKSAFASDPEYNASYYSNPTLTYNTNNIRLAGISNGYRDNNRIEARMWVYHQAKQYIDMGYKALHMGDMGQGLEKPIANDFGLKKTYALFNKIRNYATSIGKWVVINGHTEHELYYDNTNLLLLDFNTAPIRPEETGTWNIGNCSTNMNTDVYKNSISTGCSLYGTSTGGVSPTGCQYKNTPYLVGLDHYSGTCSPMSGCWCVWGYDEKSWFGLLSDDCRAEWLAKIYCKIRGFSDRGFLQMPLRLWQPSPPSTNGAPWRLKEHPIVKNKIINTIWKYNQTNNFSYTSGWDEYFWGAPFGIPLCKKKVWYDFNVVDPKCSSVYTWHIKRPDNNWENFTHGFTRKFYPTMTGTYLIGLRQDNLALSQQVLTTDLYLNVSQITKGPGPCGFSYKMQPDSAQDNGVKEIFTDLEKEINIYPNPAINVLNIELQQEADITYLITIYSTMGQKLFQSLIQSSNKNNPYNKEIDISNFSAGVYLVQVTNTKDNDTKCIKFTKNN